MAGKADNIVMLNSKSETKKNDQKKTTQHGDKVTQQVTYTQPLTPDQQADFAQNYQAPLAQQYQVDPNTGVYNGDVSQLLGFNPEEYQKEEEAKQRAAAFKKKEAGWANALKVVSEIASAAAGGNVYRNDLANVGREATQQEEASKDNVRKMGQAVQNAKRGQELGYAKARQEELKKYYDRYGVKINQTTTKQEDDVTTTTGGGSVTTGWKEQQPRNAGNGSGSGSGGGKSGFIMNVDTTDQTTGQKTRNGYELTKKEADAVSGILREHYTKILKQANEDGTKTNFATDFEKALIGANILKSTPDSNGDYQFDAEQLLQSGKYFNLDEPTRRRLEKATGNKVRFITGEKSKEGWGEVSENKNDTYDF